MRLHTVIVILTALCVVGCVAASTRREGDDENIFRYIGYAWFRAGELPYRDAFENKPPGVFAVWGLVWLWADGSRVVGRLVGLTANIISAMLLGRLAARVWNRPVGVLSGALFLSAACSGQFGLPFSDTETFGTLFALGALNLVWPRAYPVRGPISLPRAAIAGLLCGVAVLFKPVFAIEGALVLACILLSAAPARRRALTGAGCARAAAMVGGALVPIVLCLAYFQTQDALAQFSEVVIGSLSAPGTIPRGTVLHRFGFASGVLVEHCAQPVAFALIVLGAVSLCELREPAHRASVTACLFWLTGVYVVIATQGHAYEHQFRQFLPPLSLLAAGALPTPGAGRGTALGATACPGRLVAAIIAVAMGLTVLQTGTDLSQAAGLLPPTARARIPSRSPEGQRAVQQAVEWLTRPADRIWCYPTTSPYSDARRLSATRHFTPMFLSRPEARREVFSSLASGRARLVALDTAAIRRGVIPACFELADRHAFDAQLRAVLHEHFAPRREVAGWTIYEFRDTPGPY
jgi:hypothetical protein